MTLIRPCVCGRHHRTLVKVIVNTPLRWLQCWVTDRPWLLRSHFKGDDFVHYSFGRQQMLYNTDVQCP